MEDLQRSFNKLGGGYGGGSGDPSESLYEEVDVLSPVKAEASSYLSGVGDLMTSSNSCSVALFDSPSPSRRPKQPPPLFDEVVEVVIDEDEADQTEVEYYDEGELDESEIEEIELDDDVYEEIVVESSSVSDLLFKAQPQSSSFSAQTAPASTRSEDNTAPTLDEDEEDPEPEEQDIPSREEVAEAITYMVRQEKVVEYGLMTKQQVEEMNDLPLEEMMEIMKHFEICDNNNATIQWDLVLAMVNPDYSPPDANENEIDEEEDPDEPHSPRKGAQPQQGGDDDDDSLLDGDGDVVSEIRRIVEHEHPPPHDTASMGGSSYSLEIVGDASEESEYHEETFHESVVGLGTSMDPLIRASYTKSMVELKQSRSQDQDD